jgi:hypothetical protein
LRGISPPARRRRKFGAGALPWLKVAPELRMSVARAGVTGRFQGAALCAEGVVAGYFLT